MSAMQKRDEDGETRILDYSIRSRYLTTGDTTTTTSALLNNGNKDANPHAQ